MSDPIIDAFNAADGNKTAAAKALGMTRASFRRAYTKAVEGAGIPQAPDVQMQVLRQQVSTLQRELFRREANTLEADEVRRGILELKEHVSTPPLWTHDRRAFPYNHGIPSLMLSDLHYGEVVKPEEVFFANEYNSEIAEQRIRNTVDRAIHLTHDVLNDPQYPGIHLVLGGDNINGIIHEELIVGSDGRLMDQILGITDILHGVILKLLAQFGQVFVTGVPGNHGRATHKTWTKFTAATNCDWLVYQLLERFLAAQVRSGQLVFMCPPARDITFKIAGRAYRLSHGDQFRGGDGIIGPLGPITRGNKKKQATALGLPHDGEQYQTLIIGHFHQLMMMHWLIMNGSTKGYDEYSVANNFEFQPAQQALWLTHERYGINHYMPVLCDDPAPRPDIPTWVEWKQQMATPAMDRLAATEKWAYSD